MGERSEIERLRNALTACLPVLQALIVAEYNVETWGLHERLKVARDALTKPSEVRE